MAITTNREAVMARKQWTMADKVVLVAQIGTALFVVAGVIGGFGHPLALLGLVVALVTWPTFAIVRTMESRPPAGPGGAP